jgi:NADH:ubiquinone oxidoreductase subunit 2 (subunit N)
MNAPMIWVGIPAAAAALLFLLRGFRSLVYALGILFSGWLWSLALMLPIGELAAVGGRTFRIGESFSILGRDFILLNTDRGLLVMVYFFVMVWIIGAWFARPRESFIAFVFLWAALLVAALSVEPFLYAALLFEICILISVPLLSPPQQQPGAGIFRFLTFQSLGMPFILLAGWFLAGLEASPGQSGLEFRAGILIGIGLSFLLSVVPFHSWIPSLAEENQPYVVAFIIFLMPIMVGIFGLGFLDRFVWLRDAPLMYQGLRLVGAMMMIVGGTWAAVERHLGRMLGHAAIAETGIGLIAIGTGTAEGILLFFWLAVVRLFSYVLWAVAVSRFWVWGGGALSLDAYRGKGHQMPILAVTAVIGQFSLAGLPLLAGFSARYSLFKMLSGISPLVTVLALVGNIGLLVGAIRTLNALFVPLPEEDRNLLDPSGGVLTSDGSVISTRLMEWILYGLVVLILLVVGVFPQLYLPWVEKLLLIFERLGG